MKYDCHIHVALDGVYWKAALAAHRPEPDEVRVRACLRAYADRGITFVRDGGDRFGATELARRLAPEYGLDYRTPVSPLCRKGRYGSFIGRTFSDMPEYRALVKENIARGADFIKLMVSGIMDFDHYGVITSQPLELAELRDMVAVAHDAGLAVMAHANGARTIVDAVEAGVDSVEHGAYPDDEALCAMAEKGVVWVPTLVTIAALVGDGRYPDEVLVPLRDGQVEGVRRFAEAGGLVAVGSDAGAYRVLHGDGGVLEWRMLREVVGDEVLRKGNERVRDVFRRW